MSIWVPRAADGPARPDRAALAFQRIVEAHRDLQPFRRPVDRLQRALDLGHVGGACTQEELAAAAAQRAPGLDQGLQRRQHLVDGPVAERDDFKGLLRDM